MPAKWDAFLDGNGTFADSMFGTLQVRAEQETALRDDWPAPVTGTAPAFVEAKAICGAVVRRVVRCVRMDHWDWAAPPAFPGPRDDPRNHPQRRNREPEDIATMALFRLRREVEQTFYTMAPYDHAVQASAPGFWNPRADPYAAWEEAAERNASWAWATVRPQHHDEHPQTTAHRIYMHALQIDYRWCCAAAMRANIARGIWPVIIGDLLLDMRVSDPHNRRFPSCSKPWFRAAEVLHPASRLDLIMTPPVYDQLVRSYDEARAGVRRRLDELAEVPPIARSLTLSDTAKGLVVGRIKEVLELLVLIDAAFKIVREVFNTAQEAREKIIKLMEAEERAKAFTDRCKPMPGAEDHVDRFNENSETLVA